MRFVILLEIISLLVIITSAIEFRNFNVTKILHQYSMLCGPAIVEGSKNALYLPLVPEEHNMCPTCIDDEDCFLYDKCCPDIEFKFPPRNCVNEIVYLQKNRSNIEANYDVITTCPKGANINVTYQCTKSLTVYDKIENPPVTSYEYHLTFSNQYCAKCNKIQKVIPWKLDIFDCDLKFNSFDDLNEITAKAIENNCTIRYKPSENFIKRKLSCTDRIYINKCNVTGTWGMYDKDIEYACQSTNNPFPPYQNIFCYMCNPPLKSDLTVIGACNITGLWRKYNVDIKNACDKGQITEATYPYKNIYCFICNTNKTIVSKNRQTYSVQITKDNTLNYYVFDKDNSFLSNVFDPPLSKFKSVENYNEPLPCQREFRKWKLKISCTEPIPVNLLDANMINFIEKYGLEGNCNLTQRQSLDLKICRKQEFNSTVCKTENVMDINWVCENSSSEIIIVDRKSSMIFQSCDSFYLNIFSHDIIDSLYRTIISECNMFNCNDNQYVYPIEYILCNCCTRSEDKVETSILFPAWNIFSRTFYSDYCDRGEIFDSVQKMCRKLSCFPGKQLVGAVCEPLLSSSMNSMPLKYKLPYLFTPENSSIQNNVADILQDILLSKFNITSKVSAYLVDANKSNSFFADVDVYSNIFSIAIEQKLINFSSHIFTSDNLHMNVDYDFKSLFHTIEKDNLTEHEDTKRSLVTNLLLCPHVIFSKKEYILSTDDFQIEIISFTSKLRFYEYHIDHENNVGICLETFDRMLNIKSPADITFFLIMVTCTVVSALCLFFTLFTYCFLAPLRTIPGKNIMHLVFSLLLYQVFYLLLITIDDIAQTACQFIGILTHYFLLATFLSFSVCTIHMYKVFGKRQLVSPTDSSRYRHLLYLYAASTYGCSGIIIVGNIIVNFIVSQHTSIGYGIDGKCFISNVNSFIVTVLTPLTLTFILNISLYSITIYRLNAQARLNLSVTTVSNLNKHELCIFVKLFITTGCSWLLLLVNFFVEDIHVYVLTVGLNSLQGLYVFLAYVFKKRIFLMYKSKFSGLRLQKPSNSST